MSSEPEIKYRKYLGGNLSKNEFARGYHISRKTLHAWIKRSPKLKVASGKFKILMPTEINNMIKHFGDPDWSVFSEYEKKYRG